MAVNCSEIRPLLQDYVTRELAGERRAGVDAHLLECADCQRELALFAALVSTLDHQPVTEPVPDFTARVIRRLPERRGLGLSPWWALAGLPVLAIPAWFLRGTLVRWLLGAADLVGLNIPSAVPASGVGYAQLTWAAMAGVVFALAVLTTGAYLGWRIVRDR